MVSWASALSPSPLEVPSEGTHHLKGRTLLRPGTDPRTRSYALPESHEFPRHLCEKALAIAIAGSFCPNLGRDHRNDSPHRCSNSHA